MKIGLIINIAPIDGFGVSRIQNGLGVGRFVFTHEMLGKVIPTRLDCKIKNCIVAWTYIII